MLGQLVDLCLICFAGGVMFQCLIANPKLKEYEKRKILQDWVCADRAGGKEVAASESEKHLVLNHSFLEDLHQNIEKSNC